MLSVVVAVLVLDQLVKAYAWRTLDEVRVNPGGNPFTGPVVDALLEHPVHGAVLDVANAAALALVVLLLARRCRSRVVAATGALAVAGWVSNLADRLGLHRLTAPGSGRGVVDYVPVDGHYWNLADLVIGVGSAAFVVAVTGVLAAAAVRPFRARDGDTARTHR